MQHDIYQILEDLNSSNSTNHKLNVLKENKENVFLQRLLSMTYDKVKYTYGVSVPVIEAYAGQYMDTLKTEDIISLEKALDILESELSTRKTTGHDALKLCNNVICSLADRDADVFKKVINRDLRINVGRTQINKVWKGLITKPVYMRCGTYSEKTAKNIEFPAYVQLKADGTYREFMVNDGSVTCRSRSGEEYEYPELFNLMKNFPDGVYFGELTVRLSVNTVDYLCDMFPKHKDEILEHFENGLLVLPRALGNGLLKSDTVPHKAIRVDLWDVVEHEEYNLAAQAALKDKCTTPYAERFEKLQNIIGAKRENHINVIETHEVQNVSEALKVTSLWMNQGFEGSILKDKSNLFKDGTSKHQLKLKIEIDCEVRIQGFQDGKVGTAREGFVGSIVFSNDEGTIKGRTSGFTEKWMKEFTANPDKYIGKVMTVQFNDISKSPKNAHWALSHPRFIEIREDKDETDTIEKVQELRKMALELS